ncbi:hypothetical protein [Paenarthrobacter sp.]|uniref:hypothetical protein n=1 Tax=Paenarthrobacter sp. TaxID=1931993 RepID=UPI002810F531|nr:hypothetical protein [Paenarthrobacter sp.]
MDSFAPTCSTRSTALRKRRTTEEDPADCFAYGGWQAPLFDDAVGEQVESGMAGMDALLLGRQTFDIYAGYWPHQDGGLAQLFNASRNMLSI